LKQGYLIKIIPPKGYRVLRLEFERWHAAAAAGLLFLVLAAIGGYCAITVYAAEARVHELGRVTDSQQQRLSRIGQRAEALGAELHQLQSQNQQIKRLMGADRTSQKPADASAKGKQTTMAPGGYRQVAERLTALESQSAAARNEADRLRRLAMRVLNVRRMEDLAKARLIAAIPSIDPVDGASVASSFGWRIDPWPSFHAGVDLDANYGDQVRAAAAGTVASVGWDGGYGLKVDIDHGNGYHTWYAHLSRASVSAGDYVRKAQPIASVGESGDATGPHLHYQVLFGGHAIDPAPFLDGVPPKVLASLK
jgi:murein DD-endopeptidase MepM/ murein hydrolase activator NlpD